MMQLRGRNFYLLATLAYASSIVVLLRLFSEPSSKDDDHGGGVVVDDDAARNSRKGRHGGGAIPSPLAVVGSASGKTLRAVLLSDTHGRHRELTVPPGDLLVHAGDFTKFGNLDHAKDFNDWLGELPHEHKVVIAGNHDGPGSHAAGGGGSTTTTLADLPNVITNARYLQDSGFDFWVDWGNGGRKQIVRVWGSPWQPQFQGFETYRPPGNDIAERWAQIPDDTTILVTHTPPEGRMDGGGAGCRDLSDRISELPSLRLVAFGHFHENGVQIEGNVTYVNCAVTDYELRVVHGPTVITLTL